MSALRRRVVVLAVLVMVVSLMLPRGGSAAGVRDGVRYEPVFEPYAGDPDGPDDLVKRSDLHFRFVLWSPGTFPVLQVIPNKVRNPIQNIHSRGRAR